MCYRTLASKLLYGCLPLAFLTLPWAAGQTINLGSAVELRFAVTDCWGQLITPVRIQIISPAGTTAVVSYPQVERAWVLPGRYTVIASADSFSPTAVTVVAGHGQINAVMLCLSLSPIELPGGPGASLRGTVGKESRDDGEGLWVRLTAIYSDLNIATFVNEDGSFTFKDLQPGKYRVTLFRRGQVVESRELDVRHSGSEVALRGTSLTDRP